MAITTFAQLSTAVANWLDRTDLTDRIPEFIALGEGLINARLRCKRMLQRSTTSASTQMIAVPNDYVALDGIYATINSKDVPLDYISTELSALTDPISSGPPTSYTVIGGEFRLVPAPDTAYTITISYYKQIPALTVSATTNWLLTLYPQVYVSAAVAVAYQYIMDDAREAKEMGRLEAEISQVMKRESADRMLGSTLNMRAV